MVGQAFSPAHSRRQAKTPAPPKHAYSLLIVDVHELGVDYVVALLLIARRATRAAIRTSGLPSGAGLAARLRRLVHRLGQLVAGRRQLVRGRVQFIGIAGRDRLLGLLDRLLDVLRFSVGDLRAMLLQRLLHVVDHGVGAVAGLDGVPLLA